MYYNYELKYEYINKFAKTELKARKLNTIFNNSYSMETKFGKDIKDFTKDELIEFIAKSNALSDFRLYKSEIQKYTMYHNKQPSQAQKLQISEVIDYMEKHNICAFFTSMDEMIKAINDASFKCYGDTESAFFKNTVIISAIFIYNGLSVEEFANLKRLPVVRHGIDVYNLVNDLPETTKTLINDYARKNAKWLDDFEHDNTLVRNMRMGKIEQSWIRNALSKIKKYSKYDLTMSNIIISGYFNKAYSTESKELTSDIINAILNKTKYKDETIKRLYSFYCNKMNKVQGLNHTVLVGL